MEVRAARLSILPLEASFLISLVIRFNREGLGILCRVVLSLIAMFRILREYLIAQAADFSPAASRERGSSAQVRYLSNKIGLFVP